MMKEFTISIPATLNDIKVKQWQKFCNILDKNKGDEDSEFVKLKMLEIFCGVDFETVQGLPLKTFEEVVNHVSNLLNSKVERINTFKLRGTDDVEVEFGLIPNLDEMSYGEFVDIEKYLFEPKQAHRAMAVLYRPVQYKKRDAYHIQRYKGSDHLAEVMLDAPLDVFLGVQVFFYNLVKKLGLYTMDYTLKELQMKEEETSKQDSVENGVSTKQSIHWHREMLQSLIKLQDLMSINA